MKKKAVLCVLLSFMMSISVLFPFVSSTFADESPFIGTVTIVNTSRVYLRSGGSTSYSVVDMADPGDTFTCTGITAGGWFELLLNDGRTAYVSPKMAVLTENTVPPVTGGAVDHSGMSARVPVFYLSAMGEMLNIDYVDCAYGYTDVYANDGNVPGYYARLSLRQYRVHVDEFGAAVPNSIIFTYASPIKNFVPVVPPAPAVFARVPVFYISNSGELLKSEYIDCYYGSTDVYANDSNIPAQYVCGSLRRVRVNVFADGSSNPGSVLFIYYAPVLQSAPAVTAVPYSSTQVPVYYRNIYGSLLYTAYSDLLPGTRVIYANDALIPAGYSLIGSRAAIVTVSSSGVASPSGVTFTYISSAAAAPTAPPSFSVSVPVYYMTSGGSLLFSTAVTCRNGLNTVYADDAFVPAGYTLTGSRAVSVSVSSSGAASPASIVFTYTPLTTAAPVAPSPVSVPVPVYYITSGGTLLYSTSVICRTGANTVYANDAYVPAGYTLSSSRQFAVTVLPSGDASPSAVTFIYSAPAPAATPTVKPATSSVTVPVYYITGSGSVLYSTSVACREGANTIYANDAYVPAGYTLVSSRSVTVMASPPDYASPSSVTFTYSASAPPATPVPTVPPVSVAVPVTYMDESSVVFYSESVYCIKGNNTVVYNTAMVPKGYTLIGSGSVNVYVNSGGNATPVSVTFTFRAPGTPPGPTVIPEPDVLPVYQKFHLSGNYPIYSGPDTTYYRANDGRAFASDGGCRAYGFDGEWLLMGYGLTNGDYRIGYADRAALPADIIVQDLVYAYRPAVINKETKLTDDPIVNSNALYYLQPGTEVTFLAMLDTTRRWAMIELYSERLGGVMVRSFVNANSLDFTGTARDSAAAQAAQEAAATQAAKEAAATQAAKEAAAAQAAKEATAAQAAQDAADAQAAQDAAAAQAAKEAAAAQAAQDAAAAQAAKEAAAAKAAEEAAIVRVAAQNGDVLPEYGKVRIIGTYPVYSGPDISYYRADNGKAAIMDSACRVYGSDGGWILIGYELKDGGFRIGYVERAALPANVQVFELSYSYKPATIMKKTRLTDDPVINAKALYNLPVGTQVTYLVMLDAARKWAMVELYSEELGGVMVRGFVDARLLDFTDATSKAAAAAKAAEEAAAAQAAQDAAATKAAQDAAAAQAAQDAAAAQAAQDAAATKAAQDAAATQAAQDAAAAQAAQDAAAAQAAQEAAVAQAAKEAAAAQAAADEIAAALAAQEAAANNAEKPGKQNDKKADAAASDDILPMFLETSFEEEYPVYSGPDDQRYYRADNGMAVANAGTPIRAWGTEDKWLMIAYGLADGSYRVGFTDGKALSKGKGNKVPQLKFAYKPGSILSESILTDDPFVSMRPVIMLTAGAQVTYLAMLDQTGAWAYIELYSEELGIQIRGFVPAANLTHE